MIAILYLKRCGSMDWASSHSTFSGDFFAADGARFLVCFACILLASFGRIDPVFFH
jgi:hypothetical protein